jgi:hypothetical protein
MKPGDLVRLRAASGELRFGWIEARRAPVWPFDTQYDFEVQWWETNIRTLECEADLAAIAATSPRRKPMHLARKAAAA